MSRDGGRVPDVVMVVGELRMADENVDIFAHVLDIIHYSGLLCTDELTAYLSTPLPFAHLVVGWKRTT